MKFSKIKLRTATLP